jgi:hypothetical protein
MELIQENILKFYLIHKLKKCFMHEAISKLFYFILTFLIFSIWNYLLCHNPNLGLATKLKACKGARQEWSLGVSFHAPRSVGECEGMNLHIPK